MESPLSSWCYNCNAYRRPDFKFRWAKKSHKKKGKKSPEVEFQAKCPSCGSVMIPDAKIRSFAGLMVHRLEIDIEKAKQTVTKELDS